VANSKTVTVRIFACCIFGSRRTSSIARKFRWIDLGIIDFVPGAYFWFAHGHNPALDAIFVDRVVLIGAQ
jgi:hypothetical protein